jgi:ketosteroid isomerase-like protein
MNEIERATGATNGAIEEKGRTAIRGAGPGETVLAFTQALLDGDADAAATYFSPLARMATPDGTEVSGRAAIGQLLGQLVTPDQRLEIRTGRLLRADSVALCNQSWKRSSRAVAVEGFESASTARLVLQRCDGAWQILIAAPWGW